LLAGAVLLLLVIAAFFGYARYKVHRALVDLPGKLGATITKEFNGWTYSQSDGKRTVFTIHAAKAVQHKDGNYSLHDVNMVLYGKKGDRADRISGDDFEYDTKSEVIRAIGLVHIDLQAPEAQSVNISESARHLAGASAAQEHAGVGTRVIHIKTSGLVYLKSLGIAATKEGIEFAFGGFTGHAVGAEYNSDTGHVILQSAVTVSGLATNDKDKGRPIAMTASHGELDRGSEVAVFDNARYSSAGQTAQAELARLHMRGDGTVDRIEGERHVRLEDAEQGSVTSDRADVALDTTNKPRAAVLLGDVHFVDDEPLRQAHGDSDRAHLAFDAQGHLNQAFLEGRVHASERLSGSGDTSAWSQRDLTSDTLDLALVAADSKSRSQLRDAKATGSARLTSVAPASKGSGTETDRLDGDILTAHFVPRNGAAEISTVHGAGHTRVEQVAATGPGQATDQTSFGNILDAEFRPSAKGKGSVELATATQQGGVVITRILPAKKAAVAAAPPEVQHATAAKAIFDADGDRFTLTGSVQISDATSTISAARVVMQQDSGDATADGSVKASYSQPGSAEPVHVLGARAELNHDAARATFYGSAASGGPGLTRMWQPGANGQGGSQIEAPVLVFEQEEKRLLARPEVPGTPGTVHAVLVDSSSTKPASIEAGKDTMKPLRQGVFRITSSVMVYSEADRRAEFSGGVKLLEVTGEMHAQQATVFLNPAPTGNPPRPAVASPASGLTGLFGGQVERIVATQHIEITQPGRKATGERLVYTASDQMFVLTGTAAAPPRVVDAEQGTTIGAALRFHSGDGSVVVSGRDGDAPAQKVRTETHTKETAKETRTKQ
jgi:lipopolysaccharide export system protein LptA